MLPKIWIFDTYSIMIFIGVLVCFFVFMKYTKKHKISQKFAYDILILSCISIGIGIGFAVGFQVLFDLIKGEVRGLVMTFYGGLIGGIATFLVGYFLVIRKRYPQNSLIYDIAPIAPACISIAHAFGRVGCFMAGCCYGKETSSWLGIKFPNLVNPVYPTQLFEALFLLILGAILLYLALKKRWIYTLSLYLLSYGLFRFLLEFVRGDNRGGNLLNLSPSQFISIIAVVASIFVFIIFRKIKNKNT